MSIRPGHAAWPLLALAASAACSSSSGAPRTTNLTAVSGNDAGATAIEAGPGEQADGCPTNSGFLGDEMCLAPPPPGQGFQLHYGPTNYASAADVAPFVLQPSEESVDCFFQKTTNTEDEYIGGFQFYMRPGSHHLLVNGTAPHADGFDICGLTDNAGGGLGGSQTPKVDELTDPAPENQGLAMKIPANTQAVINFHVIDTGNQPLLREAWLNYWYMDPSKVTGIRGAIGLTGGLGFDIQPGTHQNYTYSCSPTRPIRVTALAAHMHEHALRMTAWKVSGGQATLVYQAFDWADPPSYRYDSVSTNPVTDLATKKPGATTGALTLAPGDSLQWECEIANTSGAALTFRNEALTGEMCLLTGGLVPADDPMDPYDFTCARN